MEKKGVPPHVQLEIPLLLSSALRLSGPFGDISEEYLIVTGEGLSPVVLGFVGPTIISRTCVVRVLYSDACHNGPSPYILPWGTLVKHGTPVARANFAHSYTPSLGSVAKSSSVKASEYVSGLSRVSNMSDQTWGVRPCSLGQQYQRHQQSHRSRDGTRKRESIGT